MNGDGSMLRPFGFHSICRSSSSSDSALTNALRKYQHKPIEKVFSGRVIAGALCRWLTFQSCLSFKYCWIRSLTHHLYGSVLVTSGVVKNARYASGNRIVFELSFKNKKTEEVGLRELTKLLVEEPQPKETPDAAHAKPEDEETDDVISDTDDDADDRMDTGDSATTPARTPSAVQQVATADASNRKSSPATEGTSTPIEA